MKVQYCACWFYIPGIYSTASQHTSFDWDDKLKVFNLRLKETLSREIYLQEKEALLNDRKLYLPKITLQNNKKRTRRTTQVIPRSLDFGRRQKLRKSLSKWLPFSLFTIQKPDTTMSRFWIFPAFKGSDFRSSLC